MGNLLACLGAAKRESSRDTVKRSPSGKKRHRRYKPVGESPTPRKLASLLAADDPAEERSDACGGGEAAADVDSARESRSGSETLRGDDNVNSSSSGSPQSESRITSPLIPNSPKKKVTFDMNVTMFTSGDPVTSMEETDELKLSTELDEKTGGVEGCSRMPTTYPGNHRYQNCEEESGDGFSEADSTDNSEEDDDIDFDFGKQSNAVSCRLQEESFDSCFSLQVDDEQPGHNEVSNFEVNSVPRSEQKAAVVKDQSLEDSKDCILAGLNLVDGQSPEMTTLHADKENFAKTSESKLFFTPDQSMHSILSLDSAQNSYASAKQEFSVDSSLSCWLTPAYATPAKGSAAKSSCGLDDRPILGALTVDDLKRTASSSSRKSPRSPDETPILGTVGSYWNPTNQEAESGLGRTASVTKGIPNTTSKYREDKLVSWHSTPFEERLERALRKQNGGL